MRNKTAARYASWLQQSRGLPAAPVMPVGDSPNGQPVMVEFLIDGVWTDTAALGLVLADQQVNITSRGRSGEGDVSQPGTATFSMKNNDAAFSLANPMSPYWGKVVFGTRVRISVPSGLSKSYRFQGRLTAVPQEADISGNFNVVDFEASGILRPLGQGQKAIRSPLYRELTTNSPWDVGYSVLRGYWPMEDADGSSTLAEVIAGKNMTFTGAPNLAAYDGFVCSQPIPNMNGSSFSAKVPTYTPVNAGSGTQDSAELVFLLSAPSGITAGTEIARATINVSTGAIPSIYIIKLIYTSTNTVNLTYMSEDGTLSGSMGATAMTVAGVTQQVQIMFHCTHGFASSDTEVLLYRQLTSETGALLGHDFIGFVDLGPFSSVTVKNIAFNPGLNTSDFYIGHAAVLEIQAGAFTINGAVFESLNAYAGEAADARFDRLCREESITHETVGTYGTISGNDFTDLAAASVTAEGVAMGYQTTDTLLDLLRACEASDDGILYEMTSDYGLGYRTRRDLQNQSAIVTLDHGNHELSSPLNPLTDDSFVANDVTVTRIGGSSANVVDTTSRRSVNDPPAGMGRRDSALDLNLYQDVQAGYEAQWAVHKGTVDEARYKTLSVELSSNELAGTVQRNTILSLVCGDRVVVTNLPSTGRYGFDDISQLAVGFTETIDHFTHTIVMNTIPESPYRTGVLGSSTKPRANTTASTLVYGVGPTDTSLTVQTLTGAVWVDSATYATDFPFDIRVNGEVMTVTAITGTSSPQTFTVTRSVNSVVKGHDANSSVSLNQRTYVGM